MIFRNQWIAFPVWKFKAVFAIFCGKGMNAVIAQYQRT